MTKTLIVLALLITLFLVYLAIQGVLSKSGSPPGLLNGKLSPCGAKPNCVSSEHNDNGEKFVEPLKLADDDDHARATNRLLQAINALGGTVRVEQEGYIAAEFRSLVFRFVDDVEIRIDSDNRVAHIRSASRVGYSDLGTNRERVEQLRQLYLYGGVDE